MTAQQLKDKLDKHCFGQRYLTMKEAMLELGYWSFSTITQAQLDFVQFFMAFYANKYGAERLELCQNYLNSL